MDENEKKITDEPIELGVDDLEDVDTIMKKYPGIIDIVKKGKFKSVMKIEKKNEKGYAYFSISSDFEGELNRKVIELIQEAKRRAVCRGAKRLKPSDL